MRETTRLMRILHASGSYRPFGKSGRKAANQQEKSRSMGAALYQQATCHLTTNFRVVPSDRRMMLMPFWGDASMRPSRA